MYEPDMPLVYLHGGNTLGNRVAIICPLAGESMGVLLKQVKQLPGYQQLWRGAPKSMLELKAKGWVMRQLNKIGFQVDTCPWMDYCGPTNPAKGMDSARRSFASAVAVLAKLAGQTPSEVLVIKITEHRI
jgi:hypothetical protein